MTNYSVPRPPARISVPELLLPERKFIFSFLLQQQTVEKVPEHFFFSFEVSRPFFHSVPTVKIGFSFIANIWMDMIVENKDDSNRSGDSIEILRPSISIKDVKYLSTMNNAVLVLKLKDTDFGQCSIWKHSGEMAVLFLKLTSGHKAEELIQLSNSISFSCAEPVQFVSVLKQESMETIKYRVSSGKHIEASWMYISYEETRERRSCPVESQSQSTLMLSTGCLYHVTKLEEEEKLWSWQEASDFCEQLNGHLPVFLDKHGVEDLIDQLKTSEIYLLSYGCIANLLLLLFIGLKVMFPPSLQDQVSWLFTFNETHCFPIQNGVWLMGDPLSFQSWAASQHFKYSFDAFHCDIVKRFNTTSIIQPQPGNRDTCTMMVSFSNLVHIEWFMIDCKANLHADVFCVKKNKTILHVVPLEMSDWNCLQPEFMTTDQGCFKFVNPNDFRKEILTGLLGKYHVSFKDIQRIEFIFLATASSFPSILALQGQSTLEFKKVQYGKYYSKLRYKISNLDASDLFQAALLTFTKHTPHRSYKYGNLVSCASG